MSTHRVSCINKRDHKNPHERILAIGGVYPNGSRWKLSEDDAIKSVENGHNDFYVTVKGETVKVIVAERNGRKYLKTEADGDIPDNLLSLSECT